MMNPQVSSIPQNRHSNRGRSNRDTMQHHNVYQHRAQMFHAPGTSYNQMRPQQPHNNRVLIANAPAMGAYPPHMGPRPGLATNIIPTVRQPSLFQQQQQIMPPQQFPHQFTPYLPNQSTQMPINLMQNPGATAQMMAPQIAPMQPQPPLQMTQQQTSLMRRGQHSMGLFTSDQQQQQQQQQQLLQQQQPAGLPQTGKKRSSAIKIIDPNTNTEVYENSKSEAPVASANKTNLGDNSYSRLKEEFKKRVAAASSTSYQPPLVSYPVSGFVPVPTTEESYLPNAIITKPPIETSKPKQFPPVLDGPSESQISGDLETGGESALITAEAPLSKTDRVNLITKLSPEVPTVASTMPVTTSGSEDYSRREKIVIDGKIRYERDFMLKLKNMPVCWTIPTDLKKSFVFTSKGHSYIGSEVRVGYHSSRAQGDRSKKVLHKGEKLWMVQRKDKEGADTAEAQTQELYRKFQSILNKLTPQKFQALAEQALRLEINTEERLSGCIDKIFNKALEEPMYGTVYANLCKVMSPIKIEYFSTEGEIKQTNFRTIFLDKCQKEFEDKKDGESLETMQKELESADMDVKHAALKEKVDMALIKTTRRSLNYIRFIGELFKLQMLSETILLECIAHPLKSISDEEGLECYAKFKKNTGKESDSKEAAKGHIDVYFKRINDIIKKGKVPARVRFMLQDVIELRGNSWVFQVRQDQQVKIIDQIHAEAAIEEAKKKEMVQQHQLKSKGGIGGKADNRRGSEDDHMTKVGDYRREREKFDQSKLNKLIGTRKDKGSSGQSQLAPAGFLRPGAGWKKPGAPSSDLTKSKVPPRSSTSGLKPKCDSRAGSRAPSMLGTRRSHTTPESEKESLLQAVNKFMPSVISEPSALTTQAPSRDMPSRNMPPRDSSAQAILCSYKRPYVPVSLSEENILSVQRKITSILDELVINKDYREAIECVKEIDLPGAMKQVVVEGINHTLEQKALYRPVTGQLFSRLVQEKVISQHDFTDGLSEILEMAEDMCIDIPKTWDYLGEVLCPVFAHEHIPMSVFKKSPPSMLESGKASVLVAKLLSCCRSELKNEEKVKRLWSKCGLQWEDLGVHRGDLKEFLDRKNLTFLLASKSPVATRELPQSLLESLHSMLVATDSTTDDVNQWIKKNCASQGYDPALLVTNLTSAVVQASVSGTGDHALFNHDLFERRIEVVKTQGHYGVAILHGLQYSVAKLSHPPKLLHELFNIVYDLDLVDEQEFYTWRDDDRVMYAKGTAIASVKPFFDWLKGAYV